MLWFWAFCSMKDVMLTLFGDLRRKYRVGTDCFGEEREKGRGFMQRIKERWGAMYPRRDSISKQNLRDNAVRFRKDPDVMRTITIARRQ